METKAFTFSIIKYLGLFDSIIFSHSHNKLDFVPDPFFIPSDNPAKLNEVQGNEKIKRSILGISLGNILDISPLFLELTQAL